jgi:hypothetical protein
MASLEDYERRRNEWIEVAYRPKAIRTVDGDGRPVRQGHTSTPEPSAVQIEVDVARLPSSQDLFAAASTGGKLRGDYRWHEILVPPSDDYGPTHPITFRLDLDYEEPHAQIVIVFSLITAADLSAALTIAATGNVELVASSDDELDGTVIPLNLPWPELGQVLSDAVQSGAIHLTAE